MNVVLEGPDGGGKSTLAAYLADALDMRVQQGSGPPRAPGEIERRLRHYLGMTDTIFDRHPAVSQIVYGQLRSETMSEELSSLVLDFYHTESLIIYCRSENVSRHKVKDDENPAHVAAVTERYDELVRMYDLWALRHANLIYRIGDDQSVIRDVVRVIAC